MRFCWAAANLLSPQHADVDAAPALTKALYSVVSRCDDGFIMRDLREEPRVQLTKLLAQVPARRMTAVQRVQVGAEVAKKSQRLKDAKTDGTSQLLRQLEEHAESGAALPLAQAPRTGREEAADRHAGALAEFASDIDIAEDLRHDVDFLAWFQRLCRAADIPLDNSGVARHAILSVVRQNAVDHHRFATAFETFIDELGQSVPRNAASQAPTALLKGERAVCSRKSDELTSVSYLRGTVTELGATEDDVIVLELGFSRLSAACERFALILWTDDSRPVTLCRGSDTARRLKAGPIEVKTLHFANASRFSVAGPATEIYENLRQLSREFEVSTTETVACRLQTTDDTTLKLLAFGALSARLPALVARGVAC